MNARVLLLPLIVVTACSGQRGCSGRHYQSLNPASNDVTSEPLPATPVAILTPSPVSTPAATPGPLAGRRAQMVARIATLTDSECDTLVLQFQLVPRDEILDPLSEPRKDLLRYVKRIARDDELNDLERAIINRKRPSTEELDAMKRAKEDRKR
ncbi:MAG: hypothetical protein WCF18_21035 [Chthoniobacteraceae bacterium]